MTIEETVLLTRVRIVIGNFSKVAKEMSLPLPVLLEDALRVYQYSLKSELVLQHIERGDTTSFEIPEAVPVYLSRLNWSPVEKWLASDPAFKPKDTAPQAH